MYDANVATTGGFISDAVNLGIVIRLFADGDVYDLGITFDVNFDHCNRILYDVLEN